MSDRVTLLNRARLRGRWGDLAIIDVGVDKTSEPGDVATLIGPAETAIHPHEVARRTETGFLAMIQGRNPRLPRIVV